MTSAAFRAYCEMGAKRSVREAARQYHSNTTATGEMQSEGKNPAAVALGRLGGLKGGKARAEKLSAQKRSAIAKQGGSGTLGTHPSRKVEPPRGLDGELLANRPSYAEPPHPKI